MERKGSEHLNVDSKIFKSPMSKEDNSLENSKNMSSSNSSDTPSHLRKKGSKNKKHKTPCKVRERSSLVVQSKTFLQLAGILQQART
ncbi:hypothetical protein GJ496_002013 [Pomphorhynchus laevis]|nr:hypothetical protein GJ496_002013 [Pomphorhynchus laevis]